MDPIVLTDIIGFDEDGVMRRVRAPLDGSLYSRLIARSAKGQNLRDAWVDFDDALWTIADWYVESSRNSGDIVVVIDLVRSSASMEWQTQYSDRRWNATRVRYNADPAWASAETEIEADSQILPLQERRRKIMLDDED